MTEHDEECLTEFIIEDNNNLSSLRTFEILYSVQAIKAIRNQHAIVRLRSIKCPILPEEINPFPDPPSRNWLSDFALRNGIEIKTAKMLEKERISAGYSNNLKSFLIKFSSMLLLSSD